MALKLLDTDDPFFRPLWRRIAIVAVTAGWASFEFINNATGWGLLFSAISLYCIWGFFIRRPGDGEK